MVLLFGIWDSSQGRNCVEKLSTATRSLFLILSVMGLKWRNHIHFYFELLLSFKLKSPSDSRSLKCPCMSPISMENFGAQSIKTLVFFSNLRASPLFLHLHFNIRNAWKSPTRSCKYYRWTKFYSRSFDVPAYVRYM